MKKLYSLIALGIVSSLLCLSAIGQKPYSKSIYKDNAIFKVLEYKNDTVLAFTKNGFYVIPPSGEINSSWFDLTYKNLTPAINLVEKANDSVFWLSDSNSVYKLENLKIVKRIEWYADLGSRFTRERINITQLAGNDENNLWVADTRYGVFQYKGSYWTDDMMPDDVTTLHIDKNNRLYIGATPHNLNFMNPRGGAELDAGYCVGTSDLFKSDSTLLISCWGGLFSYGNGHNEWLFVSTGVKQSFVDANDTLWMLTDQNEVYKVSQQDAPFDNSYDHDGDVDESAFIKVDLPSTLTGIKNIMVTSESVLWVNDATGLYSQTTGWRKINSPTKLTDLTFNIQHTNDYSWISSANGLTVMKGTKWWVMKNPELQYGPITFYADKQNNLWISNSDNVTKYIFNPDSVLLTKTSISFAHSVVSDINMVGDTLLVGSNKGLYRYYNNAFLDKFDVNSGLKSNDVKDIEVIGSTVWLGLINSVAKMQGNAISDFMGAPGTPFQPNKIKAISNSSVWLAAQSGLFKLNNSAFEHVSDAGTSGFLSIDAENSDRVWLANASGAYLYSVNQNKLHKVNDNWPNSGVNDLLIDLGGKVWITTNKGIHTIKYEDMLPPEELWLEKPFCNWNTFVIARADAYFTELEFRSVDGSDAYFEEDNKFIYFVEGMKNGRVAYQFRAKNKFFENNWSATLYYPPFPDTMELQICQGDSVLLQSAYQTKTGIYNDTLETRGGCDSIIVTNLSVLPASFTQKELTLCNGDSIKIGENYITEGGEYKIIHTNEHGCDSIISYTITEAEAYFINQKFNICEGDSVLVDGKYRKESRVIYEKYISVLGCDSTIRNGVCVHPNVVVDTLVTICEGDYIRVGNKDVKESGIYYDTLKTQKGCDSVMIYAVKVELCPTITDADFAQSINLYPNPSSSKVYIDVSGIKLKNSRIELIDAAGNKLICVNPESDITELDISKLAPSIYFIVVGNQDKRAIKRFVKYNKE